MGERAGRIRVLQFAYGTSLYGAERWVLTLIKHLDRSKVETIVGCIRDADSPHRPLIDEAARLGFPTLVIDGRRRKIIASISALRAAMRDSEIDIIHTHGPRQDVIALLATRSLGRRVRILSTPHGWQAKAPLKARLHDALSRGSLPFFDAVAPLSAGLVASLRSLPIAASRLHFVTNAVDLDEVEAATPLAGRLPGQSSGAEAVIGYVGQLIPRKGVDVLLRALVLLGPSGWCCLVLGDGPARADLERQAAALGLAGRVRFLGFRPDRLRFMKRFDLLVLPSYREGIPRAVMEALAAGIPCVGSGIPGLRELLEDGLTGTTFPPGDAAGLAEAIRRSLHDREQAGRLAAAGRARVRQRHAASALARSYEVLYARLCARG